jgi:hypothetical protein
MNRYMTWGVERERENIERDTLGVEATRVVRPVLQVYHFRDAVHEVIECLTAGH